MDQNFLLETPTAQKLFHEYASQVPVLDYHCHINPQEIAEDRKFENITQVWLGGDHYKWRQMRSNGVDEYYITGGASDREKFQKWAETLEKAIGNPLYHWSHLELRKYFGYEGYLNGETAEEVWNLCNAKLQEDSMSVRNIIKQSNVTLICTTDDPVDDLKWHQMIAKDDSFDVQVLPAWRPDKAMNLEKPEYLDYVKTLSEVSEVKIDSFKALKEALVKRLDYFQANGCKVSDHGIEYVMYVPADDAEVERIFVKRLAGEAVTKEEELKFEYNKPYKLCTFSRVIYEKGIEDAIQVVRKINEEYNKIIYELDIYGPIDEEYKDRFTTIVNNAPEYIQYKGCIDSKKSVNTLKNYYLLLFPTKFKTEGIPGTIIDALSAGVPIIASRWDNVEEIISHEKNGLIYDFNDLLDFKINLEKMINTKSIKNMKKECLIETKKFQKENVIERFVKEF